MRIGITRLSPLVPLVPSGLDAFLIAVGELLSAVVPVRLIKSIVKWHFSGKIPYMVYMNLSRLATQWEESINRALLRLEKQAARRIDELIATVERLIETGREDRA